MVPTPSGLLTIKLDTPTINSIRSATKESKNHYYFQMKRINNTKMHQDSLKNIPTEILKRKKEERK